MDDDRTSPSRSEFPQTFFRGKVTPDGLPIIESLTVSDEAERMRALSEGWTQDKGNAVRHAQYEKLGQEEQQHRDHQAANRRREELLEQVLTKLLASGAPPPAPSDPEPQAAKAARRRAFVEPRLKQKGITVNGWAKAGNFDPNTGYRYLAGENILNESRVKLAAGLGVDVDDLPE